MNWEDEPYVRVYTRNTPDWAGLPHEGRLIFYELCRNANHAGVVEYRTEENLARTLLVPADVLAVGLSALLADGCVQRLQNGRNGLVMPNFHDAQTAARSDRLRQVERRRRKRDEALGVTKRDAGEVRDAVTTTDRGDRAVTNRDATRLTVTERDTSRIVTPSPVPLDFASSSRFVTPPPALDCALADEMSRQPSRVGARDSKAEQSEAEPSLALGGESARGASRNVTAEPSLARKLWEREQHLRGCLKLGTRPRPRLGELERIQAAIERGLDEADGLHALAYRFGQAARDRDKARYLEPATLWGPGLEHALGRELSRDERRALDRAEGKAPPERRPEPQPEPELSPEEAAKAAAEVAALLAKYDAEDAAEAAAGIVRRPALRPIGIAAKPRETPPGIGELDTPPEAHSSRRSDVSGPEVDESPPRSDESASGPSGDSDQLTVEAV